MEYTIAAIPTKYNGRMYRSRLEAKWAAFFDIVGFSHEYEPFDLNGWAPDFLVKSFNCSWLVDVKPLESFDVGVSEKIGPPFDEHAGSSDDLWPKWALISRLHPIEDNNAVNIGWVRSLSDPAWTPAYLAWMADPCLPEIVPLIFSKTMALRAAENKRTLYHYRNFVMDSWSSACNRVQWMGEEATA